jgi:hypothetical protein
MLLALLVLSVANHVTAFAPFAIHSSPSKQRVPRYDVFLSQSSLASPLDDESTYVQWMAKAREYAFSDSTTSKVGEIQSLLRKILEIQGGCAGGLLSGHELCENQLEVAEIVSHLRAKIHQHDQHVPSLLLVEDGHPLAVAQIRNSSLSADDGMALARYVTLSSTLMLEFGLFRFIIVPSS